MIHFDIMIKRSFPLLTISEIQVHLRNIYNLSFITEDDLTKPRQETLKIIFIRLLQFIYKDITVEFFQLSESEKKTRRFPDCHDISVPNIRLFKILASLFSKIGCKDDPFKLVDILKPEYKRTRYYLSGIINYIKFISEELSVKMNNNENFIKNKQKFENFNLIQEQQDKLQLEVSTLRKFLEDNKENFFNKMQQIEELEQEKKSVLEQKNKIEDKLKIMISEIEGLQNNILTLSSSFSEAQNLEKVLKSKIVENSEEIFRTLELKREELENLKNCVKEEKSKSHLLNDQIDKIEIVRSKVKQTAFIAESCLFEYNKLKELNKNIESLKYEKLVLERKCYDQSYELTNQEEKLEKDAKWREMEKINMESKLSAMKSIIEGKKIEIFQLKEQSKKIVADNIQKTNILKCLDEEYQEAKCKIDGTTAGLSEELRSVKEIGDKFSCSVVEIMRKSKYLKPFLKK